MHFSKAIRSFAAILTILLLCGCEYNSNDRLMRPPYPAGDGKEIQEQLTRNLGNIVLKYPKSGAYRSAIIQVDLNGDNNNEAIAFYRGNNSLNTSLAILREINGKWSLVTTKESDGGEIDRVLFGDMNNDGTNEIIVGWTIYSSGSNIISAYDFENNTLKSINVREFSENLSENISVAYTDMQIYDFDNDGRDEIIASYINLFDITATAKFIEFQDGIDNASTIMVTDTAPLDGHVLSYTESKVAKITDDNIYGVVLDGMKDSSTSITEYIYWDNTTGDFLTPFYDVNESSTMLTTRNISTVTRDIDSDGIIDIPITQYMPGYDADSEMPMFLTTWYSFDTDNESYSLLSKKSMVINTSESYSITWQSSWDNKVTCRIDEKNRILYFYHYHKDKFAFSDEIFRIKVFTLSEWEDNGEASGYMELIKNADTVYAASVTPGQSLADRETIKSYFNLM